MPDKTDKEIYDEHHSNPGAKDFPEKMQCQCEACKRYRAAAAESK